MANRYLRGTFIRNAWDFYEVGCAYVYGNYTAPAGVVGFIFINNGVAQSYLDVYRAEISFQGQSVIHWSIATPSAAHNSIEPDQYFNVPVQLDLGAPPGDMAVYTSPAGPFSPLLKSRVESISNDWIELQNGGPFLTLPPLYGLAVAINMPAPGQLAMSVWYQSLTDQQPPAN
jgi:hypothetical protein